MAIRNRVNLNGDEENDNIEANHNVVINNQKKDEKLRKTLKKYNISLIFNFIFFVSLIILYFVMKTNNDKITFQTSEKFSFGLYSYNQYPKLFFSKDVEKFELKTQTSIREREKFNLKCNENYENCTISSANSETYLLYDNKCTFRFLSLKPMFSSFFSEFLKSDRDERVQECFSFKLVKKADRDEFYYQLLTCHNEYIKFSGSTMDSTKDSKDPNTFLSIKKE